MSIIDSIQLSGVTYQIQGSGGGGVPESTFTAYTATTDERISQDEEVTAAGLNALNDRITPTVELTQAQYDALVDKDPNTYYIITDAQAGDLTNYYTKTETNTLLGGKADTATTYTKTETDNAITAGTSTKQDTLVSGTNIKTINNTSLLGSGNIDIQGGGGGKAIEAGTGIAITTGETADTVSLDISAKKGSKNTALIFNYTYSNTATEAGATSFGYYCKATNQYTFANGNNTQATGYYSHSEGENTIANGWASHSDGQYTNANGKASHTEGSYVNANNDYESSQGRYNVSNKANTTFGDSGNTLFSVGNGTGDNARHNAFEIRQNGDIYLTKDGQDIKLQDQLGGSSITVDTALSSTSENPVQNKVIYNKIDEVEQVTAAGLNALNDKIGDIETLLSQI